MSMCSIFLLFLAPFSFALRNSIQLLDSFFSFAVECSRIKWTKKLHGENESNLNLCVGARQRPACTVNLLNHNKTTNSNGMLRKFSILYVNDGFIFLQELIIKSIWDKRKWFFFLLAASCIQFSSTISLYVAYTASPATLAYRYIATGPDIYSLIRSAFIVCVHVVQIESGYSEIKMNEAEKKKSHSISSKWFTNAGYQHCARLHERRSERLSFSQRKRTFSIPKMYLKLRLTDIY